MAWRVKKKGAENAGMKSAFRFGSGKDVEMWRGGEVALALCFLRLTVKTK